MRIAIELNGVLRDTLKKMQQEYEKWYLDNPFKEDEEESEYEVISDLSSLDIGKHLKFKDEDELYNFLYKEHTMEIFGHAGSVEVSSMMDFNDFYLDMRDNHDIIIVSDEIGKSKPASLFFLAKFGCLIEQVVFYSESTKNRLWDKVDILITANPATIESHPEDKIVIKYQTKYNESTKCEFEISTLSDFNLLLNKINKEYV